MADSCKVRQPGEHLYRDDGAAALERAARLEDENRRLRSEIERLRRGCRTYTPTERPMAMTAHSFIIGVATATTCFGMALVFLTDARPHHHHAAPPPRHTIWQGSTGTPAVVAPAATTVGQEDCRVPWIYANGEKHYKLACVK